MKLPHKILTSAMTLFISVAAIACASRRRSETKTSTPAQLPQVPRMLTLSALVRGSYTDAEQILLNVNSTAHAGLSISFSLNPNEDKKQNLGIIHSIENMNLAAEAVLLDGRLVGCELGKNADNRLTMTQPRSFSLNCAGQQLELELNLQAHEAKQSAAHMMQKSIQNSAGLFFHSKENVNDKSEVVLRGKTLYISEYHQGQQSQFNVQLSSEQLNILASQKGDLQLPCPVNHCGKMNASIRFIMNADGQMNLIIPRRENDPKSEVQSSTNYERTGADALRVASYNVENFWDDVAENSNAYDDFSPQLSDWYSEGFAHKKARRIREALLTAGLPDVVGLQEIESAGNRSRSLELLKPVLASLGYNYYALGLQSEDNPTAVTTAFVSKFPILENNRLDFRFDSEQLSSEEREDFINASRDPQRVTVGLPEGIELTLLNSHWKSKRDKSPLGDVMRQKIGELMRNHLEQLAKSSPRFPMAMIMGDFNSDYREAPVQNGLRLAQTLAQARSSDGHLFNLWQTRPATAQGDYPHDGELTAIDNIVVSGSLLSDSPLVLAQPLFVAGEFGIAAKTLRNGDFLPFRSQRLQVKDENGSVRTFHRDSGYSDHLPLIAELQRSLQSTANIKSRIFAESIENQNITQIGKIAVPAAKCLESETRSADSSTLTSVLSSAQRGDCLLIEARLMLRKTGLHNVAFDLDARESLSPRERIVILTADRAFAQNKQWLRSTLQQSAGKAITRIRGRVGMIDGVKAIFISEPTTDIAFEN